MSIHDESSHISHFIDESGFERRAEEVVEISDIVLEEVTRVVANDVQQPITVLEEATENETECVTQPEVVVVTHAEIGTQSEPAEEIHVETVASDTTLGRGMRKKESSVRLLDYVVNTVVPVPKSLSTVNPDGSSEYGIENFVNCERFSESHRGFLANVTA